MPAVAVTSDGWMRELAVEFLLLLGRQQRTNLIVGLQDELIVLAAKILVQLNHFAVLITHQRFDLMQLVGRKLEFVIEPFDEAVRGRHS